MLVPVKDFRRAKVRLAPVLAGPERAALARRMATRVVRSAAPLPVAVVCDDVAVASWAEQLGAEVIWAPGSGLNAAVGAGVAHLAGLGADPIVVAAGDLPHADGLAWVARFAGVTVVPDRRHDGTNVIAVPSASPFPFAYGPGSYRRHLAIARGLGLPLRVVYAPHFALDVDLPEDLAAACRP